MIRIALDAMGGDNAPEEIIKGAVLALNKYDVDITLVGDTSVIRDHLEHLGCTRNLPIVHSTQVAGMEDAPSEVIRKMTKSSIIVATRLVADGKCDAVVSAGSTGAQMASALFILGRIKGVARPGIMTPVPTMNGGFTFICDCGSVPDSSPKNLMDFAIMTSAYAEYVQGVSSPRVGLLNIGEEPSKGSVLAKNAHKLLSKVKPINFVGNIESRSVLQGDIDVIVTDGFTGNVLLKAVEGISVDLMRMIKNSISSSQISKMGGFLIKGSINKLKKMMDYSEYGGAPLLGVKGVSIISHGVADAKTISNAIGQAVKCVEYELVDQISKASS